MVPIKSCSREIIKILEDNGWHSASVRGGHHYFERATKERKVKIPLLEKDVHPKTARSIFKQAGFRIRLR